MRTFLQEVRGTQVGWTALAVVGVGVLAALGGITGALDPLSLLITVGGALAVARVTFGPARLESACGDVVEALRGAADPEILIEEIKRLARIQRVEGVRGLERAGAAAEDAFVQTAVALSLASRDRTELEDALRGEARRQLATGESSRQVLLTLGKLFPAFGLIGTLLGLVLLLRSLAGSDFAAMGAALGVAVQTTLYGVVLSNVVVLPLATKLHTHLTHRALTMSMAIEGILLVQDQAYPSRVERALRTYVSAPGVEHGQPYPALARAAA